MKIVIRILLLSFFLVLAGCNNATDIQAPDLSADLFISGGPIVTMETSMANAEAVVVKDGQILAVGALSELEKYRATAKQQISLEGNTLLPGFIDGHSHFAQAIASAKWGNVSGAPVGNMTSIADIIAELKSLKQKNGANDGEWLIAYGYDADTLSDGRDINRDDIDAAFPDNPVVLIHVSFHGAVLNSKGFEALSYDANTPTPAGGIIVRRNDSNEPLGLVMETAWFPVAAEIFQSSAEERRSNLMIAQQHYAANGITTAQDGAGNIKDFELFKEAATNEQLQLDLVVLGAFGEIPQFIKEFPGYKHYNNRLKIGGIKLVTDGSPQGKTAFFTEPFLTGGPGGEENWHGEPLLPAAEFEKLLAMVYEADMQAFVHANADAAIDMLLNAHKKLTPMEGDDSRTVIIHSQFVRPDQLQDYAHYGMVPSFFTNHAYFWGDVHVKNLGVKRAHFLSPLKTVSELGLHFTNHSDYMVTPLNPLFTVWSAVNRVSRSGAFIGEGEKISPERALRAITIDGAWQYFEEDRKGSIAAGKLADLVILDANPLSVDPMTIKDIKVLATYKEGVKIH
ncbi:MAG: amidohydrolase family protein [Pseudomonadota bacterium]